MKIDRDIFRSYDIRGIVADNLSAEVVWHIGRGFGQTALEHGEKQVVIAGDGRLTTPALKRALAGGLNAAGCDVLDIGLVPTPVLYYATQCKQIASRTGVMVTGSHNPPEYNGLKLVLDTVVFAEEALAALYERISSTNAKQADAAVAAQGDAAAGGLRSLTQSDISAAYISEIKAAAQLARPLKIVVDAGNGIAGTLAPVVLDAVGVEVVPLYCEVDGHFPNHHPDPAEPKNLNDLSAAVLRTGADFGVAFDGDGDRLGAVTASGRAIFADQLMMLFVAPVLAEYPGASVVFDVKCTRHLSALIESLGGVPILWKTGHSRLKAKIAASGARLGGEYSGHICFADRWYGFDDALYAAVRLAELVAAQADSLDTLFDALAKDIVTPELKIQTTEACKFATIAALSAAREHFTTDHIIDIDGLRVEYEEGWGLIRASNTSPTLTLRFEASDAAAMQRIQAEFAGALAAISPELRIPEYST